MESGTRVSMSTKSCAEAAETVRSGFYLGPSFANMLSAIGSFVFFWLIYLEYKRRLHYHVNAKILIMLNLLANLAFSVATIMTYGIIFINTILASDDCDFFFSTHKCSNLRFIFLFSIFLTTMAHVSLVIERLIATVKLGEYQHYGKSLGSFLSVASIVIAYGTAKAVTFGEDPNELITNCFAFSTTKNVGANVYNMFICQAALEIIAWVTYYLLQKYHAKIREHIDGHLGERFQQDENEQVIRQIAPLILVSSGLIMTYIVFSSIGHYFKPAFTLPHYKQLASFIFLMPHNSFITMALFYFRFRRSLAEKQQKFENAMTSPVTLHKPHQRFVEDFWKSEFGKYERSDNKTHVV